MAFSILIRQLQKKLKAKFDTMCISNQYRHLDVDKAQRVRNRTADIMQEEFAKEMNGLVHEELRRCCEA